MAESHPLVSLIIATYNHKKFVRETVAGALSQDYPNLEIVISDDCSPDGTFEILQDLARHYSGPHKLTVRKNDRNLGLVPHVNKLLSEFTHGEYVMLSGGDDVCLPQTISFAVESLESAGVDSMSFNMYTIDGESRLTGVYMKGRTDGVDVYSLGDYIKGEFKTSGACRIFKRDIYKTFGSFADDCQTEDTPNLLRTFLYGKVGFCYTPNFRYRRHGANISGFDSLMSRFDPEKIHAQYARDLDVALEKGLVGKADYSAVLKKLEKRLRGQKALRRLYRTKWFAGRLLIALSYMFKRDYTLLDVRSYLSTVRNWRRTGH